MNVRNKILNTLMKGEALSVKQARARFGASNISARVAELRDDGHKISTNKAHRNGKSVYSYRLNTTKKAASKK